MRFILQKQIEYFESCLESVARMLMRQDVENNNSPVPVEIGKISIQSQNDK